MRPLLVPPPSQDISPASSPPTFSVIIAAYQAAATIGDALASVAAQTVPPYEIVVCDDGSTDALDLALEPFRDEIVLVRKENGGEASAKNASAVAASGDFVVILDADDVYEPERLEALAELSVRRPDLDILTTDAVLEVEGRAVRHCYDSTWPFEIRDQRRGILERNFVFGLAAVRRDRLLEIGGFDEAIRWTADWECWIRLILSGSRVGLVDQPLARYRLLETSLSARRTAMIAGRVQTLEKTLGHPGLGPGERVAAGRALEGHRLELAVEEARASVLEARDDARSRLIALALDRRVGMRTRLRAAVSAIAPALARRVLIVRRRRVWIGAAGVRVPRRPA